MEELGAPLLRQQTSRPYKVCQGIPPTSCVTPPSSIYPNPGTQFSAFFIQGGYNREFPCTPLLPGMPHANPLSHPSSLGQRAGQFCILYTTKKQNKTHTHAHLHIPGEKRSLVDSIPVFVFKAALTRTTNST